MTSWPFSASESESERTPVPLPSIHDLRSVIRHLHETGEQERIALHRKLHDDLGNLMIAAGMDVSALIRDSNQNAGIDPVLQRMKRSVMDAINLNRRLTEDLRPSILDNLGLFAALRWHIKQGCAHSAAVCSESYPDQEIALSPQATTGIYRIAREAMAWVLSEPDVKAVYSWVNIEGETLEMRLAHEHNAQEPIDLISAQPALMHGLAERTRALQGDMEIGRFYGGTILIHRFALRQITDANANATTS